MFELEFQHKPLLWLLSLIPALAVLWWLLRRWQIRSLKQFAGAGVFHRLIPDYSASRPGVKMTFFLLAVAGIILGLANPRFGSKLKTVKREGAEIIIALDVSNSMLAEDISPNRLEAAKQSISQLVKKMRNDRLGLVVFAGDAFVQLPVTSDYNAARMFLRSVSTDIMPVPGTAIGRAIRLSLESFSQEGFKNKALVLISDGENHEDDALVAAQEAMEAGVVVHTIGIGSPDGVPIPVYTRYGQKDYRRDKEQNIIVTKLNESMLQQVAAAGGGSYVRATNASTGLNLIYEKIGELEKKEFEVKEYAEYESWFQLCLGGAILFLLLELLILPRRNRWLSEIDVFKS